VSDKVQVTISNVQLISDYLLHLTQTDSCIVKTHATTATKLQSILQQLQLSSTSFSDSNFFSIQLPISIDKNTVKLVICNFCLPEVTWIPTRLLLFSR